MGNKKLLDSIKEELWKGYQTKEVVVGEHKFILKTLNDGEEVWRDKFIPASANYGFISGAKAPTVAVALVSIDAVSVRDIFLTDEEKGKYSEEGTVKTWLRMLGFSSLGERFEVAQRVYDYVSELPSEFVDNLYSEYNEIEKVRKESVEGLLKKIELDNIDGIKVKVMLCMGWGFDHSDIEFMNVVRWSVLHTMLQEREISKAKSFVAILKQLLGVEIKEGVMLPLAAFINPEIYQKLSQVEFGSTESEEGTLLSEDEVIELLEEMDENV